MSVRPRHLPFSTQIAALKASLSFGAVAASLGLSGSSKTGWQCPACHAPAALKERANNDGGRCGACGKGFDILTVVTVTRGLSPGPGLGVLEELVFEQEARAAGQVTEQGGLF